ncbi:MAG: head decoration protein [Alphaproteobacteria bacterium]|nr:head decoration protein [Alphaproteobacteria bacterium]
MSMEENHRLGDLLKYEADKNYCREVMTVASGQNLKMGTVVGIKSATEEIKSVSISEEEIDGSDSAFGVLLEDVDATSAAKKALVIARDAILASDYIVFPNDATADQKKKITKDLEKRGIVIRQSA